MCIAQQQIVHQRNKRRTLPSRGHVCRPEIGHHGRASPFYNHGWFGDLKSGSLMGRAQI